MGKDKKPTETKVEKEELTEEDLAKIAGGASETNDVAQMLRTAFTWRSASDD